jgi:MoxR-like ATPase
MRLRLGYPSVEVEKEILTTQRLRHPVSEITHVVRATDVLQCQALLRTVHVSDRVKDYIVTLADETRRHPALSYGCSPRACLALMRVSQGLAAFAGRDYVMPRDVRCLAPVVLGHRLSLTLQAREEWECAERVVDEILDRLPVERWETL